jgi:hypothetical protein
MVISACSSLNIGELLGEIGWRGNRWGRIAKKAWGSSAQQGWGRPVARMLLALSERRHRSLAQGLVAVRSAFEWMINQRVPVDSVAPQSQPEAEAVWLRPMRG